MGATTSHGSFLDPIDAGPRRMPSPSGNTVGRNDGLRRPRPTWKGTNDDSCCLRVPRPQHDRRGHRAAAPLGDDAKVLSGGQSLIPLMKLRLASPAPSRRHQRASPGSPGIREADGVPADRRADPRVRSRGIGARADPLSPASRHLEGDRGSDRAKPGHSRRQPRPRRSRPTIIRPRCWRSAPRSSRSAEGRAPIPIATFFTGPFETALKPDEILVEIRIPVPPARQRRRLPEARAQGRRLRHRGGRGAGHARRQRRLRAGRHRAHQRGLDADQGHEGRGCAEGQSARTRRRSSRPPSSPPQAAEPAADLRGSVEYKKDLVRVLTARALRKAVERARGEELSTMLRQALGQRREARGGRRATPAAGPPDPRGSAADRHPHRLRYDPLRRLHGPPRRPAGEVVHDVRRAGPRASR